MTATTLNRPGSSSSASLRPGPRGREVALDQADLAASSRPSRPGARRGGAAGSPGRSSTRPSRRSGCRAAGRSRRGAGRRCGRRPARPRRSRGPTRADMMLELSPLVTAASAPASVMPGLHRGVAVEAEADDRGSRRSPVGRRRNDVLALVDDRDGVALLLERAGQLAAHPAAAHHDDVHGAPIGPGSLLDADVARAPGAIGDGPHRPSGDDSGEMSVRTLRRGAPGVVDWCTDGDDRHPRTATSRANGPQPLPPRAESSSPRRCRYRIKNRLLGPPLDTDRARARAARQARPRSPCSRPTTSRRRRTRPRRSCASSSRSVGVAAFTLVVPITVALLVVLGFLILSYRQTIKAYPTAGGAYIVTRDNFGLLPAQVAGVALLTDYVLTVAVSVAAGTAALASAFPALAPYSVRDLGRVHRRHRVREPQGRARVGPGLRGPDVLLHRIMVRPARSVGSTRWSSGDLPVAEPRTSRAW